MKLSQMRAVDGAVMVVRDFRAAKDKTTGLQPPLLSADGTACTLTLLGLDSAVAKQMHYARAAAARNRVEQRLQALSAGVDAPMTELTPDDIAAEDAADLDLLVALTTGWSGFEDDDDQPAVFSPDAVRTLYAQCPPIREQALAFIGDRTRFFGGSKATSAATSNISSA